MKRRNAMRILGPAAVLVLTGALAACGGSSSNGEADKTPTEILTDGKKAALDAGSVHVSGSITDQGTTIGVDLRIGKDAGAGTMTLRGSKIDLVRVGDTVYIRAPASFYTSLGAGQGVGQLLDGKWLKASATSKEFADLAQLTAIGAFTKQALKPDGTVTKGSETTVDGQKVIELKSSKGGSLYVATTGKPYPVELKGSGTSKGTITFSDWGASVKAQAPAKSIDLSQLGSS
jgi:hypothetical protein